MTRRSVLFVPILALLITASASAQPVAPSPPPLYDVQIRYEIVAFRNERVAQYYEMMRDLRRAGFVRDPNEEVPENEPEDTRANRLSGTIASERVPLLLKQRHIRSVRLTPSNAKMPAADQAVRVHLGLVAGLESSRQRQLYEQARALLPALVFQEGAGYDNRGFSRIVGSVPVKNLDALLLDLRRQPQAWKLLSKTLLSDLRGYRGGQRVMEAIVTDWYGTKAGKRLIGDALLQWRVTPSGKKLLDSLPFEVTNDPSSPVLQEQLLADLLRSPDAAGALEQLLADVYTDPAAVDLVGSMLRRITAQLDGAGLPVLFRGGATIRVIEVLPGMPLPQVRPIPKLVPPLLEKVTPDLRDLAANDTKAATPLRLEVILALTPDAEDRDVLSRITSQEVVIEGRLGPVLTVSTTAGAIKSLAALDAVAVIRYPRLPQPLPAVAPGVRKPLPLQETGVARLHALGHRGKGTVVAVLDADFRGWEAMVKAKQLPKETHLIDLTSERNRRLDADPFPVGPEALGVGTRYALTIAAVAPEVELLLVRIDAAAPYMIQNVAKAINSGAYHSLGLEQRLASFDLERGSLDRRNALLLQERREVFGQTVNVTEADMKRPEYQQRLAKKQSLEEIHDWLRETKRVEYRQRQAQYDKDAADLAGRVELFFRLQREFNGLKRVRVVVSSLVWDEGYPVDGSSPLSRFFDDRPFKAALWFQAGGDARSQVWTGPFRDDDGSGSLKFAAPETRLPKGLWSHEYNFLKWQPANGPEALDLPAGVTLRLVLQWREAHDPFFLQIGEDRYRDPLAKLNLVLTHQPDPLGKQQPSDDMEVIAESVGPPQRLLATANSATYEQIIDVRVPKAGRYAVRVEGRMPLTVAPTGTAELPSARKFGELKPRLFVRTLDGPGRVLLRTYWTDAGSLGMPADAHQVIAVGAVDRKRERQPYSSRGPAYGLELLVKPDVLAYDEIDGTVRGSGQATAFAAAIAAVTLNANAPLRNWVKNLGLQPGDVLRVPEKWPR